jgi:hypothetical protein
MMLIRDRSSGDEGGASPRLVASSYRLLEALSDEDDPALTYEVVAFYPGDATLFESEITEGV